LRSRWWLFAVMSTRSRVEESGRRRRPQRAWRQRRSRIVESYASGLYLPRYQQLSHHSTTNRSHPFQPRAASVQQSMNENAEHVERDHRRRENRLRHHIAGWRDYRRGDEDDEESVLEVPQQEARGHHLHLREEEHDGRHLEDQAHAEQH